MTELFFALFVLGFIFAIYYGIFLLAGPIGLIVAVMLLR